MSTSLASNSTTQDEALVDQLSRDSPLLKVRAAGSRRPLFIQQALLTGVSQKLVDYCMTHSGFCTANYEVLRMFMSWVIDRKVMKVSQETLTQAWMFGARFVIPTFQNCVIRELVRRLHGHKIRASAVNEAYCGGPKFAPLQKAFIWHISRNLLRDPDNTIWAQEEFEKSGLGGQRDFFKDLAVVMCVSAGHKAADDRSRDDETDLEEL